MKNLTNRLLKAEQKQSSMLAEVQQATAGTAQLKASLRGTQKQVEAQQAKLQQEVKSLGQEVEQLKGGLKKAPGAVWQRAQEQVTQAQTPAEPVALALVLVPCCCAQASSAASFGFCL